MGEWTAAGDPVISTLRRHLERTKTVGIVLDVDDVVAATRAPRFELIAAKHGLPPGMTVAALMARYQWVEDVPEWQTPQARADMDRLRESAEHHGSLQPLAGALAGVTELDRIVQVVAYVTNRPAHMRASTVQWLRRHGFPAAPVVTRPAKAPSGPAADWKVDALAHLHPHVLGIVDDNAGLLDAVPWDHPARVYVFGARDLGQAPLHPRARMTPTWEQVHAAVRAYLHARAVASAEPPESGLALG
jgi:hypothetical protein